MSQQLELFSPEQDERRLLIDRYSPIYNMHMYWTKQKPEVVSKYIARYCPPGGTVMDAFCGSGMTGVAARMMGRDFVESDLSPLCAFLARNFTSDCDVAVLKSEFFAIAKHIEKNFEWLLHTECNVCENDHADLHAVIFADDFVCPHCSHQQNHCANGEHLKLKKGEKIAEIKCSKCKKFYSKKMKYFAGSSAISIEADCAQCKKSGKNNTRLVHARDAKWLAKIDQYKIKTFVPRDVKFQDGINTRRCQLRRINHPYEIFSKRNLILLSTYWSQVQKRFEDEKFTPVIRDKLLFIATSSMFHGSLMRRWLPYRSGVPLKGTLFVPSISEDVDLLSVLKYQADRVFKGQREINELPKTHSKIKVSSALNLNWVPDGSVDYLYFDPPFGGHINYSELNVVWEAWLGTKTNPKEEVIVNRVQKKTNDDYAALLKAAIAEGASKLRVGGHFTIVFAHSDLKVWRTLQLATLDLPLKVEGAPQILDSANKTFIQLFSDKAQQNMITFTFKKTKLGDKRKMLSDNFVELAEEIAFEELSGNVGVMRDALYDKIVQQLFNEALFDTFNLDHWLTENAKKISGKWFLKRATNKAS